MIPLKEQRNLQNSPRLKLFPAKLVFIAMLYCTLASPFKNSLYAVNENSRGDEIPIPSKISQFISDSPSYAFYTMHRKEKLRYLANLYKLDFRWLRSLNRAAKDVLAEKGKNVIVLPKFFFHTVESGDTLSSLSLKYRISLQSLKSSLGTKNKLRVGETLLLPLKRIPISNKAVAAAAINPAANIQNIQNIQISQNIQSSQNIQNIREIKENPENPANTKINPHENKAVENKVDEKASSLEKLDESRTTLAFSWPVKQKNAELQKSSHNKFFLQGLFFIAKQKSLPIYASEEALVVYSGELRGFGQAMLLKHENGFFTLYGGLDKAKVQKGDTVQRRQAIAISKNLLFYSMFFNGEPVDVKNFMLSQKRLRL